MSKDDAISDHYTHGSLIGAIENALQKLGLTKETVQMDDLSPVDEFHIGGRMATEHFFSLLDFKERDNILDVGCGIGGAARFMANKYENHVTGIDLTPEFIVTGNMLSKWVSMDDRVALHQGSALTMPFDDATCDGGFMMHVGMNIEDKAALFKEVYRILRPGAVFGIYDVMRISNKAPVYPVPWATTAATSSLASPDQYKTALEQAGFSITMVNDRREVALSFFDKVRERNKTAGGPPILGLHTILGDSASIKVANMIENVTNSLIAPVEMIAWK